MNKHSHFTLAYATSLAFLITYILWSIVLALLTKQFIFLDFLFSIVASVIFVFIFTVLSDYFYCLFMKKE